MTELQGRHAGGGSHVTARRIAFSALAILFSLVWLTVGFGVIDLASGFLTGGDPRGTQVLSAAYGIIAGFVLPVAFLAQVGAPGSKVAALQQVAAVAVAFAVAGALGLDPLSFISVGMLAVMLAVLVWLHPERGRGFARPRMPNRLIGAFAAVAALPAMAYAIAVSANQRAALPPFEEASRPQAGGWSGAAALAVTIVLVAALAAARTNGWRIPASTAGLAAVIFGLLCTLNPEAPGSVGPVWGAGAIAWGLLLVAATGLMRSDGITRWYRQK